LKHLFPKITTPKLAGDILGQDNRGAGESGHQFETMYFGFKLEAEWIKKDTKDGERMDKVRRLLGRVKSKSYELGASSVKSPFTKHNSSPR
jgi:hypothetical protein